MAASCLEAERTPYLWLVQEEAGGSTSSAGGWTPLGPRDNERLEEAFLEDSSNLVPVEFGRYDIDLKRRTIRAVYWDEPERRVLRSSWFHGRGNDRTPYEEQDSEDLEAAFQRLLGGRERVPLLVPVHCGSHDVRFEALPPEEADENALSAFSFLMGAGHEKRHSVQADAGLERECSESGTRWTATQESVDRSSAQPPVPVWRGHVALAGERPTEGYEEEQLPEAVDCLVFVVHGIGQYHRSQQGTFDRFYKECCKVRKLSARCLLRRTEDGTQVSGRFEFLPLEWFEPIHVDVGIGNRLRNVTLPSVTALRDFANFAIADIMVYLDDNWRDHIHQELQRKMDRLWALFCSRTPEFSGEVSVIGHSLGSVIMFDLVQKSLPSLERGLLVDGPKHASEGGVEQLKARTIAHTKAAERKSAESASPKCPAPRCFFAIGSPLGMFLSIRFAQRGQSAAKYFRGLDVRWPAGSVGCGWRFYNIFHPDDPIAYRIEPLLNTDYKDVVPKTVLHRGGLRFHHQMREWWRNAVGGTSTGKSVKSSADSPSEVTTMTENTLSDVLLVPTVDGESTSAASFFEDGPGRPRQTAAVDRLDYVLQESFPESMNEMLSAIHSHYAYWDCEDLFQFIVDHLSDALGAKRR